MYTLSIDDYIITRHGDIINKHNNRKLKPQKNSKGYLRVSIGGKLKFVHRLVAETFIPNPDNLPQVNHINGDKTCNEDWNLEWCDNNTNRKHAVETGLHKCGEECVFSKLTESDVMFIRNNTTLNIKELSEMFNVKRSTIADVIHHRTWKQLKRYAELSRNEVIELTDKKPIG